MLALGADPQVAVGHEEVHAVLLGRDGILAERHLDHLDRGDRQLEAALGALVGADGAGHDAGGLLAQGVGGVPALVADLGLDDDGLHDARAVADLQELELALGALVVEPAADHDLLVDEVLEMADFRLVADGGLGHGLSLSKWCSLR
ncbi:hypothetical protein D3C86_1353360 [compost metagenome]